LEETGAGVGEGRGTSDCLDVETPAIVYVPTKMAEKRRITAISWIDMRWDLGLEVRDFRNFFDFSLSIGEIGRILEPVPQESFAEVPHKATPQATCQTAPPVKCSEPSTDYMPQ
jgi:hypothetical protein